MGNKPLHILIQSLMVIILLSGLILPFTTIKPAYAATVIVVNSSLDSLGNDGNCTLREAVIAANKNKPSGSKANECAAGTADDIIRLQANQVYQITRTDSGNEDSSASGDLDIRSNIAFEVTGSGLATLQAVNSKDRVFQIFSGTTSFTNLVIMGGNLTGNGGAISNQGTANIKNSLIKDNISSGRGGGIYNTAGATLTLSNSTINANTSATDGGGIANEGTLSLINTTISGNTSKGVGGGFFSSGSSTLNAVTVTANSAGSLSGNGGGLGVVAGVTTIKNSLVAGNSSAAAPPAPDCSGSLQSAGYNLVQNISGCVLSGISTGNLLGLDPKLGGLADYGGLTPTHAIAVDSPAVEAGTCTTSTSTSLTEDQRGILRPQGSTCDIGAFEVEDPLQTGPVYSVTSIIDVTSSTCTFSNCSLRDAINAANSRPNGSTPDEIHFSFPGSGAQVITLQTNLPAISDSLVIDGFSQPGASPNTLPTGSNAVRLVTLDGSQLGACTAGLTISGSGSTVKGLNIQDFSCDGIAVGGSGNQVLENAVFDNSGAGVHVTVGVSTKSQTYPLP